MKAKNHLSVLSVCAALAVPSLAVAGGGQIWYQEMKQQANKSSSANAVEAGNIIEAARKEGTFTTFLRALETAGMTDVLSRPGSYTVFAPTDAAFDKIASKDLNDLLNDKDKLRKVLGYHVVEKQKYGWDLRRDALKTMSGGVLQVTQYSSAEDIKVNLADVLEANIPASNGVIHAIDEVLFPNS